MTEGRIPRRRFLTAVGATGTAAAAAFTLPGSQPAAAPGDVALPASGATPQPSARAVEPFLIVTATEAAFLQAAVDTLIPADNLTPSGSDCGVATFIDRQLAGAWGGGARLYRSGPFLKGKPEQGYQLPLTPLEFFRTGIAAANVWSRKIYGKEFDRLSPADREAALKTMEAGKAEFPDFSGKDFFEALLQLTMEGFFADPMYGGNRNKVSWKMVGYPGLPATYADKALEYRGKRVTLEPQSIADFS